MGWPGRLELNYRRDGDRTLAHDRHSGPLRVLQSLYPEGNGICHHVLVHPPGGIVGGDTLHIEATVRAGAHALITTPSATRFYRSAGEAALQSVAARIDDGARLEWLPLETICHSAALAENQLRFEIAPGGEMMGWDVVALGLPASGEAFEAGHYAQRIELPGVWLERATIRGDDHRLLDSPLGFAGHRVLATLWFAAGAPMAPERRERLLDAAREQASGHALARTAGCSAPHPEVVVLRLLAPQVEPAMKLLSAVWARWREVGWGLSAVAPRVWRT
ncbi:MAG: urease accessory protein [Burkholderiales bacterium PBB1]|nr:MAG: urease accessory protein [Burkholderiales bacterium PBB1]